MASNRFALEPKALRWCCERQWLQFDTTDEVQPVVGVVGQDDAVDSLRFGLAMRRIGQNIFIRGLTGTGRMTLVHQLLQEVGPTCQPAQDRCYVHNFLQPDRPRLISLPPGQAHGFKADVDTLVDYIERHLAPALSSEGMRARRASLTDMVEKSVRELGRPFEEELRANALVLVTLQAGHTVQPAILPVINDKPVSMHDLEQMRAAGSLDDAEIEALHEKISAFSRRMSEINYKVREVQARYQAEMIALHQSETRTLLETQIDAIKQRFEVDSVNDFLEQLVDDLVEHRLDSLDNAREFTHLYGINVVKTVDPSQPCPIVIETSPSLTNLLGSIEREFAAGAVLRSDHLMIRGGSLLSADGGFLVLEAREVMNEPGAWRILMRALRSGKLEIVPPELTAFSSGPLLKPEPIELDIKVILIGDPGLHRMLDAMDPDFPHLFKVLVDFETTTARGETGANYYAGVIARIAKEDIKMPFSRDAVVALIEHGARIAGQRGKLTTRFGRLSDIACEAAYLTQLGEQRCVDQKHVVDAIRRGRHRSDLPARQFRQLASEGTLIVQTKGEVVGQINGLAVMQAGPLTYGFPTRITATIGPGSAGAVNIEREAELSGSIHTKGFYILGGLLRYLLRNDHPLAFSASIAFEQSYGGIDGDSASGAEMCCLISALTGAALNQSLAMTGAIDQHGHIQAIGAVSEKIEGFFAVCRDRGLSMGQGVVIPRANVGDLMLNQEVVDAVDAGQFHVYAVDTIFEALTVLTGSEVPARGTNGAYPTGSLLQRAEERARAYWQMASLPAVRGTDQ